MKDGNTSGRRTWLALACAGFLTACGSDSLRPHVEGEVYQKKFEPETVWTNTDHVKFQKGCGYTIPVQMRYTDDEDYILYIRKEITSNQHKQFVEKVIYTTREVYDSVNIGDWFVADTNTCDFEDKVAKTQL